MDSITNLMLNEHRMIKNLLLNFEKEGNIAKKKELWDGFKWTLQKHIFLEEKAIFSFSQDIGGKMVSDLFKLMEDHGEIIKMIKDLENEENFDIKKLKKFIVMHEKHEEEKFYPKLDEILNENEKSFLISRIKEIVR